MDENEKPKPDHLSRSPQTVIQSLYSAWNVRKAGCSRSIDAGKRTPFSGPDMTKTLQNCSVRFLRITAAAGRRSILQNGLDADILRSGTPA